MEQRQADRCEATAAAKARLVDSDQLQIQGRTHDLAMFNLAIDSKLRGCDVVAIKVEDIAPHGYAVDRAMVRQNKTGLPVRFEITGHTRQAVDGYIRAAGRKRGDFLFGSRCGRGGGITTRQYARLVAGWVASIGLDPSRFGTHLLRRTKATLIYRRTGNLRAVQLLLGHTKIETTARYLASRSMTCSDRRPRKLIIVADLQGLERFQCVDCGHKRPAPKRPKPQRPVTIGPARAAKS